MMQSVARSVKTNNHDVQEFYLECVSINEFIISKHK